MALRIIVTWPAFRGMARFGAWASAGPPSVGAAALASSFAGALGAALAVLAALGAGGVP
jgi:hypothetical protein